MRVGLPGVKTDAYASERAYLDHLLPIWLALPDEARGTLWLPPELSGRVPPETPGLRHARPPRGTEPMMVASYQDSRHCLGRPIVYVEHGAGQTYAGGDGRTGAHPSYSGGKRHEDVVLFICPGEAVAERWRRRYPETPAAVVGVAKMDRWHGVENPRGSSPVVTLSWHADIALCPETRWAFPEYAAALPSLKEWADAEGIILLGHGHPRAFRRLQRHYRLAGIEAVEDFSEVLDRSDVYMIDNSSTGVEFASTGRPIVWANSIRWRRDVHHGQRFWRWIRGIPTIDGPAEMIGALTRALEDPPEDRGARDAMVRSVYVSTDGHAAERAAAAIVETLGSLDLDEWRVRIFPPAGKLRRRATVGPQEDTGP